MIDTLPPADFLRLLADRIARGELPRLQRRAAPRGRSC